jgi:hydrogenase-4 transcriptional activator
MTEGIELGAWRAVSRRLDLVEVLEAIAREVIGGTAVDTIAIRRVGDRRIETLARHAREPDDFAPRTALTPAQYEAVRARLGPSGWTWVAIDRDEVRPLVEGRIGRGSLAILPIDTTNDAITFAAVAGATDGPALLAALVQLREPLQAALRNDARVHELERLRESALSDNRELRSRLHRQDPSELIVGSDSGLRTVMEQVEQVAPTEAPVLILGETGSGKEVVARAVHSLSRRRAGPFLRVNCGAIPTELVDSELFGHERGSFTGAVNNRRGWFERADGGTLLLDEVAELPPAAQVRLLRVLQDGTFERVGGQQHLAVDVRIVAATHRDVRAMIDSGEFREDLWYRISVFPIHLPPLRMRRQDIAPLVRHFAAAAGLRLHGFALHPTDADLELLRQYDWPGNVRELSAVIERAAILGRGLRLDITTALGAFAVRPQAAEPDSLQSVNRRAIENALARCEGRIEGEAGAARFLGLHPATLRSRMRKLGIEWSRFRIAR